MRRYTGFGWLELVVGVLLIILGIATLIKPGSVLTGVIVVYGIIALLTGIDDIIFYAKIGTAHGLWPHHFPDFRYFKCAGGHDPAGTSGSRKMGAGSAAFPCGSLHTALQDCPT